MGEASRVQEAGQTGTMLQAWTLPPDCLGANPSHSTSSPCKILGKFSLLRNLKNGDGNDMCISWLSHRLNEVSP